MMNDILKKLGFGAQQEEVQQVEFPEQEMVASQEEELPEDITANNFADFEAQPQQPVQAAAPVAADPIEQELSKSQDQQSRYIKLLEEYNNKNSNLGMLQGSNQIAQAIASGYGGKIGDGSDSVKMLQGMNKEPLKQLQDEDNSALVDANSDVSKMYRQQAYALLKKINPEKNYDGKLENMSASQLMKLPGLKNAFDNKGANAKGMGFGQFVNTRGEPIVMLPDNTLFNTVSQQPHSPKDGVVRPIGYTDPLTGQRGYMGPGSFTQFGNAAGGSSGNQYRDEATGSGPSAKQARPKTFGDYRTSGLIPPKDFEMVSKDKEGFEQQNAPKMGIISGLDSVETLANEAITNPNAAASLGGIIGSLFEPGKLTDEDALRYVREKGYWNSAQNWISEAGSGTLRPETAANIIKTAKAYRAELDNIVRKNAVNYASRTQSGLLSGRDVDPAVLADFYYKPTGTAKLTSNNSGMVRMVTPQGKTIEVPKENVEKAKARGAKEVQ